MILKRLCKWWRAMPAYRRVVWETFAFLFCVFAFALVCSFLAHWHIEATRVMF